MLRQLIALGHIDDIFSSVLEVTCILVTAPGKQEGEDAFMFSWLAFQMLLIKHGRK